MPGVDAPEFAHFIGAERRAGRLAANLGKPIVEGQPSHSLLVDAKQASELLRVAARRAAGFFRPTKRREVVWAEGDRELAINLDVEVKLTDGTIQVSIPVRCDQTGPAVIEVLFAVGSQDRPSGLYASTYRRPNGPEIIVNAWGESLVAFAWQCLLGMVSGLAGAAGKDDRGNVLVPVELTASRRGLEIVPMARHRFSGSSGLRAKAPSTV